MAIIEKLPPWIHLLTLIVTSLIVIFSALAHAPLPPKAAAFFRTLGVYLGGLGKALEEAEAILNPPARNVIVDVVPPAPVQSPPTNPPN